MKEFHFPNVFMGTAKKQNKKKTANKLIVFEIAPVLDTMHQPLQLNFSRL